MIFHLIMLVFGLWVALAALRLAVWALLWALLQPVRLILRLAVAIERAVHSDGDPARLDNVIPFRRPR